MERADKPDVNPGKAISTTPVESRGAALVEAAMILPVLLLVVIGTLEIGLAFKDFLTVGALSREGARVAALAGDESEADCAILAGIGSLASNTDLAKLADIQVFEASSGTGAPVPGNVNRARYVGPDPSLCHFASPAVTDGWVFDAKPYHPTERNTEVGDDDLELVGVRVTMTHEWVTGFPPFRGSFTIEESTITRVEPEAFADS